MLYGFTFVYQASTGELAKSALSLKTLWVDSNMLTGARVAACQGALVLAVHSSHGRRQPIPWGIQARGRPTCMQNLDSRTSELRQPHTV